MREDQIKQALNVRMLRADKAERALNLARATEAQAIGALAAVQGQLDTFDASYEARIAAFFERTAGGLAPGSLHSSRGFHTDLAQERAKIQEMLPQAQHIVDLAAQQVAAARAAWAQASRAADNLRELHKNAVRDMQRAQERRDEQDADEMSLARMFQQAG